MRIDIYTKALLTIIATCLVALVLGRVDVLPTVHAQRSGVFPTVIKGDDFGIRVDGWRIGQPITGTLLIQVNGQWREVQPAASVTPAVSGPFQK